MRYMRASQTDVEELVAIHLGTKETIGVVYSSFETTVRGPPSILDSQSQQQVENFWTHCPNHRRNGSM